MNTDGSSDQAFPSGECGVGYSMCDNCNHVPMCGLRYTWRNDDIHNLEGLDSTPCAKAYGLIQQRTHPGRLLRPLLRRGEKGGQPPFCACFLGRCLRFHSGETAFRSEQIRGGRGVLFLRRDQGASSCGAASLRPVRFGKLWYGVFDRLYAGGVLCQSSDVRLGSVAAISR